MKPPRKPPFGVLLLFAILAMSLSLVAFGFRGLAASRAHATHLAQVHARNLVQAMDLHISATHRRIDQALRTVASELERGRAVGPLDRPRLTRFIDTQQTLLPEALAIRVTDAEGNVILNNPTPNESASFRDRPYWGTLRNHPDPGLVITGPLQGLFAKRWMLVYARRYNHPDGSFGGVIVVPMLLDHLQEALARFDPGAGGMLSLRDAEGGFVARHPALVKGRSLQVGNREISGELRSLIASGVQEGTCLATAPFDQTRRTLAFRRISGAPLVVVASMAEEDYLSQWRIDRAKSLKGLGATVLGFWVLAGLLWRLWTDRERSTRALEESEARHRLLVEHSHDIIYTLSPEGICTFASPSWTVLLGHPVDEALGHPFQSFVHEEDLPACMAAVRKVLETGQRQQDLEYRMRHADGSWRWHTSSAVPLKDGAGRVVGFEGIARDITDRRRSEAALRDSEEQFRSLAESSTDYIMRYDAEGRHTYMNPAAIKVSGLEPADLIGRTHRECGFPEDLCALWEARIQEVFQSARPARMEFEWTGADGPVSLDLRLTPEFDAGGRVATVLGVSRDVTERKRAEALLRKVTAMVPGVVYQYRLHPDGRSCFPYSSEGMFDIYEVTSQEVQEDATPVFGRIHPEDLAGTAEAILESARTLAIFHWEFRVVLPRQGLRWRMCDARPERLPDGGTLWYGIIMDATERKLAEEALRTSEENLAITLQSIGDAVIATDASGLVTRMNPTAERLTGWTLAEARGLPLASVFRIIHARTRTPAQDPVRRVMELGQVVELANHTVLLGRDGREYQIADSAAPIRGLSGVITGMVLVFSDVSEQYRVQQALAGTAAMLERTGRMAKVGGWEVDLSTGKVFWSDETYRIHEVDPSLEPSRDQAQAFYPPAPPREGAQAALLRGEPWEFEIPMTTARGRSIWVRVMGSAILEEGRAVKLVGSLQDITERKAAEDSLRESEQRFLDMAENSPVAIYRYSDRRGGLYYSPRTLEMLGRHPEELLEDPGLWHDAVLPEDRLRLEAALEAARSNLSGFEIDYRIQDAAGRERWFRDRATFHRQADGELIVDGVAMDITHLRRAELEKGQLQAQLQQAQKMESLGSLAGGVAHDMNNVLGAVLGLASAHLDAQVPGSPTHQAFETIVKAAERGGKMVKSLLSFARQTPTEDRELDMNALLRDEARLLERTTFFRIRIEMDLCERLHPIRGDGNALSLACMNLCVNAVDAMPGNGTLCLRTRNVDDAWIEVIVEDTGTGMSPEILGKAMDPFFTTKEVGKGTGLGLSMVYSTVKAHQGGMEIQSEPGRGTRVKLRFPASAGLVPAEGPAGDPGPASPPGALSVVVVDDDDLVRFSTQALLEALGHAAIPAASGEEALSLLEGGLRPDVLILDMNMPGLGGLGTLPRLRALMPGLPVLLATGRADRAALDLVAGSPPATLLSKPFNLKELLNHLEAVCRP